METTAAWGDAKARRADILSSAERLLERDGYAGLTVRAIADGAKISSGTVYQYFQGKEDVFVALMAARLDALRATFDELDRELGIPGLLTATLPQVRELWRLFGRSAQQWESKVLAGGRRGKQAVTSATVFRRTIRALDRALRETAAAGGRTVVDDPALAHWVWDALIGVADDLLHGGSVQGRVPPRRLIEFAIAAIERSIITS
ncbi:MAG TPA: TetR/AcrR family transcriptional regulator [Actinophytocola sp.]|uniref:TetR/AcrR family transcriptional regulator n=1 Tax=Actinophytocola sp. TaxID=1872138 RepID=UPI002DBB4334|nr:TetR/AcrR family transcriptional regulator [Actinophytocola sp.]HEU5474383.1 TetR/AcrR family transcriptional regulator [Actinophytocola sp.]